MIKRFFKAARQSFQPIKQDIITIEEPRIGPEERVYAIGDVHGRYDLMVALLDKIAHDNNIRDKNAGAKAKTNIIFLGDLIDRGPDSSLVIEAAINLQDRVPHVHFLMGNHEEMLLSAMEGSLEAVRQFYRAGGDETILSYVKDEKGIMEMTMAELAEELPNIFPQNHIEFIKTFQNSCCFGDYFFVHAGVMPGTSLDEQDPRHMRWIRHEFLNHHGGFEKIIVFGHTIFTDILNRTDIIGIDTGAYKSGQLTAIGLEGQERWFIKTDKEEDVEPQWSP